MQHKKYIIIGNGIAGHAAALQIRKEDTDGGILIISKEAHHTYYRLKLTEMIAHPLAEKDLYIMTEEVARDAHIDVILSHGVEEIRTDDKTVRLDNGDVWQYDKLLLATGSVSFIPKTKGEDKKNVISLRTLEDLARMKEAFARSETVTVVGGGLLGLEAAYALLEQGLRVHVVEMAPWLLPRQLDHPSSAFLTEELEEKGLLIHTDRYVTEILGEDSVTGVRLQTGEEIPCDGVLFNIGVRPETQLAKAAGLSVDKGIIVNGHMQTNVEDVYAAGDCIEYNGTCFGLWTQSNAQGRIAGTNMTGKQLLYERPKLFSQLKLGDLILFSSGDVQNYDEMREYQAEDQNFKKIFFREGKPVGAILYGDTKAMGAVNKMLDGDISFAEFKEKHIH